MSAAQRQPAPDVRPLMQPSTGSPAPTHRRNSAPAGTLSHGRLINQFMALDQLEQFNEHESRLYLILVNACFRLYWKNPFGHSDNYLAALCGGWSVNTLKKHRTELERRGLLEWTKAEPGRGKTGTYRLLLVSPPGLEEALDPEPEPLIPSLKVSAVDTFTNTLSEPTLTKVSDKVSGIVSEKVSAVDTNLKKNKPKKTKPEREGSPAQKKIELDFSQKKIAAEKPGPADASAPHTGGRAENSAEAPLVPEPLKEGEFIPGGFADPRLSDEDPAKWIARPRDVAMIDEFLANHPREAVRAHAGKGSLYWRVYSTQSWCKSNGLPITNWRTHCEGFSFIDFQQNGTRSANHPSNGKPSGQPNGAHDRYQNNSKGGMGSFSFGKGKSGK